MIYTHIPYAPKGKKLDLGWAYNNFMRLVDDDDWVLFIDHDAMFTTPTWYTQIEDIIEKNSEFGVFTCMTNRIGVSTQQVRNVDRSNHDITYHRTIGKNLQDQKYDDVIEYDPNGNKLLSGLVILLKKDTWKKVGGFKEGYFLGVDNNLHKDCKINNVKVGIMEGVYVYHWYRGDGDKSHLSDARTIH